MTQKDLEVRLLNLEKQFSALASRPYNARVEDARAEAVKAQSAAEEAERENAENLLSMVEAMLEMSADIEDVKGE